MFPSPIMPYSPSPISSPVHPSSLVDPALHSPALLKMLDIKINQAFTSYVVDCIVETVDYAMGRATSSSPRGRSSRARRPEHAKFATFVHNVIQRAEMNTATILAALVYVDRAKPHLQIALEEWALERVFLGALMVASKYLNDSTLKNIHWALCTGVFGKRDVGRIEREFLSVLDFELGITEDDILSHYDGLASILSHRHISSAFTNPHPRHSKQHVPRATVPDLEPSSPESSSDSSSPRTPSTANSSPVYQTGDRKHSASQGNAPPPPPKKSHYASTMELIRSFPLGIPSAGPSTTKTQDHASFPLRLSA